MKISEIITDKYKLRIPPTVYYDLLSDALEAEDEQEPILDKIRAEINKPVIRDEYSQRQNDYCDGYEFVCNRIKEIIGDAESEET